MNLKKRVYSKYYTKKEGNFVDKHTLSEEIEQCRREMLDLYGKYDLTSDTVITTSMKLDQLMNDYEKEL